ncbi:hypothetical protein BaRGS_00029694 [Batillaria attramentaria]|uniref:GRIP domain-containing protein n=1 Tax=Batillaria attramentaria TaxID=370345 RepID=A0ABD0JWS5_9CAEN
MAKSHEDDKWSVTSSDLGSSFGCEGDLGSPQELGSSNDVRNKPETDNHYSGGERAVTSGSLDDRLSADRPPNTIYFLSPVPGSGATGRSFGGQLSSKVGAQQKHFSEAESQTEHLTHSTAHRNRSGPYKAEPRHICPKTEDANVPASRHLTDRGNSTPNSEDTCHLHEYREHQDRSSSERSFGISAMSVQSSVRSSHRHHVNTSPSHLQHGRPNRGFHKSLSLPENRKRCELGDKRLDTREREFDETCSGFLHCTPPPVPSTPPRGPRTHLDRRSAVSVSSSSSGSASQAPKRVSKQDIPKNADGQSMNCSSDHVFKKVTNRREGSVQNTRRFSSASDMLSMCTSTGVPSSSKETLTSRMRHEKHHQEHGRSFDTPDTYLTPSQRKDLLVKDLKSRVKILEKLLQEKERVMDDLRATYETEKDDEEVTSLQESHEESVRMVASLQQVVDDLKNQMAEREAQTEQIFLEMYNKGRESAIFEREEELELMKGVGKRDPNIKATITDLRNKLVRTQAELAKWQTIRRYEAYHKAPLPATEAETTLGFLKDSVFHYLTDSGKVSDDHLRAIVRILRFSEVEKQKIAQAVIDKRNRSATGLP